MDSKIANRIIEACDLMDIDVGKYTNYSGRFMYGETTTGIIIDEGTTVPQVMQAIIHCSEMFKDLETEYENWSSDDLGLGTIIY